MKNINYEQIYQHQYKTLPRIYFWTTFIILGLGSFIGAIILMVEGISAGILLLLLGIPAAYLIAFIEANWIACLMSPKIVAVDCLLKMKDKKDIPLESNTGSDSAETAPPKEEESAPENNELKETFIKYDVISDDLIKCPNCGCIQKISRDTCWKCGASLIENLCN